jgi:predicted aspartyl protease
MMQLRFDKNNQCFASVKVAGSKMEEIELLVDTGASYTHLDDKKCQELGLTPIGAVNIRCIHGDNKSRNRYRGRVQIDNVPYAKNDIDIIGLILEDKTITGNDGKNRQMPKFMGVMGRNVLFDLKLQIDGRKPQGFVEF